MITRSSRFMNNILGSLIALSLFALVPVRASEGEYTYTEFEINDLPEEQEEESLWEFSVGIEGVYGQAQMSASQEQPLWIPGENWWEDGYVVKSKAEVDFESFYGFNFRLNWLKKPNDEYSVFSPEVYVLLGFMTGQTEEGTCEEQLAFFSCVAGGNIHFQLSENISVYGGARLGGGGICTGDEITLNMGVNYGVGAGMMLHVGNHGSSIRLGVDYLASTAEFDGDSGFQVSEPGWVLFSLGYNVSF